MKNKRSELVADKSRNDVSKALVLAALIGFVNEYIVMVDENDGNVHWNNTSVEDHCHMFGVYVQDCTG